MKNRIVPAVLAATSLVAAELPVKRVVLYKHGVGYFERSGEVPSGQTARLEFKPNEMNDVLKSLVLDEQGGGRVTGVRYDSAKPARSSLTVDNEVALAKFLDTLRGAKVDVELVSGKISGAILSGRVVPATDQKVQQELMVLLTDAGDLRTLDLASANSVRLTDPLLQLKLREYLQSMAGLRTQEQRAVYIDGESTRSRQIRASYLLPTPIWKSSYRLILGAAPMLEGWAIVDNTTDSDWTGISLALVSGKPVSFQSRLYDPKFIERPFAELAEERAAAPEVYAAGLGGGVGSGGPPSPPPMPVMAAPMAKRSMARAEMMADAAFAPAQSNVVVNTAGRDLGELFEYAFSTPVTVKKNESAMLPFLQQKLETRKLLIYNDESQANPRTASEITNNTGKTLDGGPITVFDNGAYAGEALVETVKAGDKRLISYGIDLGTRITTNFDSEQRQIREIRANHGFIIAKASTEETKTYTIKNVDPRAKTLIIEHPLRGGYKLIGLTPTEKTATAYRFSLNLKPNSEEKFVVKEEYVYDRSYAISSSTPDQISIFLRNPNLSPAGKQALERIQSLKSKIAESDRRLRTTEAQSASLEKDQERLRENIRSLNSVSGQAQQVQRYASDLSARETKIVELRDQAQAERQKKGGLESELNGFLATVTF
ncbi:MAG: hypothetical protein NTV52_30790 [Acidobacteria bacterium]|nr:hypothetical protein [Acidobacteriota bacterium]